MYNSDMMINPVPDTEKELKAHRVALLDAYITLTRSLMDLGQSIRDDIAPAWIEDTVSSTPATVIREKIIGVYQAINIHNPAEPRNTLSHYGLIGVNNDTLAQAKRVNIAKKNLSDVVALIKHSVRKTSLEETLHHMQGNKELRTILNAIGAKKLHLRQSTRRITLLPNEPRRVGFTLTRQSRIVEKLSFSETARLIDAHNFENVANHLATLPASTTFYRIRKQAAHVRANIVTHDGHRYQRTASMPLMYPRESSTLVVHNGLALDATKNLDDTAFNRLNRSRLDDLIDYSSPLCDALHLYPAKK